MKLRFECSKNRLIYVFRYEKNKWIVNYTKLIFINDEKQLKILQNCYFIFTDYLV